MATADAAQERHRCLLVAPLLHEDVEHDAVLIDCPPQPVLPPTDLQLQLVHMPLVSWSRPAPTKLLSVGRAELPTPQANRLVADADAALSQQLLHVTMAQVEPVVQPDGVADDLHGKAMAAVQGGVDGHRVILPPATDA
jgi:hypothetical protein